MTNGFTTQDMAPEARLTMHEAICAERYNTFIQRVSRIETILLVSVGTLVTGMAGIIMTMMIAK
jgi:hypothetical protein